jgi:hypothetical protein
MTDFRRSTVTIRGLTVTREEVINTLCFPASPISQLPQTKGLTLPSLVRENPAALQAVGLVQLEVYGPSCIDVQRGSWTVRPNMIWVDQESGVPIDAATIMFVNTLPESLSASRPNELIKFLPPTYCVRREDAERLVRLLQEAGPTRGWPTATTTEF